MWSKASLPADSQAAESEEEEADRLWQEAANRRAHLDRLIKTWVDSESALVIPFGGARGLGRRDITDCLQGLTMDITHEERGVWIHVVRQALDVWPSARAGLTELIIGLGLAADFGIETE